jgi:hypothetical protein
MQHEKICFAILICITLLLFTAPAYSKCSGTGVYGYSNLAHGNGLIIDENREAVLIGDTGTGATFCRANSGFYCVESKYFNFAIPRKVSKSNLSWRMGNYKYKVLIPLTSKVLLNSVVNIMLIGQFTLKHEHVISYYYYSPKVGLLGFFTYIPKSLRNKIFGNMDIMLDTMISSDKVGFGAICTMDR